MVDVDDTTLAILYQNKDTTFAAPSKRFLLAKQEDTFLFFWLLVVLVFLEKFPEQDWRATWHQA